MNKTHEHPIVMLSPCKSAALALMLSLLLGPLGMLYATLPGAFVMAFLETVIFKGTSNILLNPFGLLMAWFLGCAWSILAVNRYNKKIWQLLTGQTRVTWIQTIKQWKKSTSV